MSEMTGEFRASSKIVYQQKGAIISRCGKFRYSLTREWDNKKPTMAFIMLNPSTADGNEDDNTIRKCVRFADMNGYGGIEVLNLFAYRATKPADLKAAHYPVGPDNDLWLRQACFDYGSNDFVCAWGANARGLARVDKVLSTLKDLHIRPRALKLLDDGTPQHPLMLPYSSQLVEMMV